MMTEPRADRYAAVYRVLRNPLSAVAAATASFLVVLALLTARVVSGVDPALRASASSAVLVSHRGQTILRTTASGRTIGVARQGAGVESSGAQPATVVTRASGGFAAGGERDE
jgi:hypothetical protein